MLVNLEEILKGVSNKDYAVAGFNIYGYEDIMAVTRAAEELEAPVILMANIPAINYMPVEYLASIMIRAAMNAAVPICVHLDHAKDYTTIAKAIKSGFTSVMYDGSQLGFDDNVRNTREVVRFAHACGVSVEAEIGSVGYADPSVTAKHIYTEPDEARSFVEETGIDAVAVAVGTIHRMQVQDATIQYGRLEEIQQKVNIPLVIHGSTGVSDEDLRKIAGYKVAKVNIGTALRIAFTDALREEIEERPDEIDRIKLFRRPVNKVYEAAKNKMKILGLGGSLI